MKARPRIVLVVTTFPKISETFVAHKFTGLLEKGWDVHIVCSEIRKFDWSLFPNLARQPDLIQRVHVNWPHVPRWIEVLLFPLVFLRCMIRNPSAVLRYLGSGFKKFGLKTLNNLYLDSQFIILKPAAIHFEFGDLAKNRTYLREFLDCKILASFRGHELNFVGMEQPDFFTEVWEKSDRVVFVSNDLLHRSYDRGFARNQEYSMILGSVDCSYFNPGKREIAESVGTSARPLRILSIGRLSWSKGYEYGLNALQRLMQKGIHFEYRIAGDGPYREAIHFAIQDLGIKPFVKLLSWQSPSEIKQQMEWADVFLHSSVSEGFGIVVLEAQAMALPVVCTDADGLNENIVNGKTGFVVPRRDGEALAEKLLLLCQQSELRQKMGEAGRQRASTEFTVENEISGYNNLFCKVLNLNEPVAGTRPAKQPASLAGKVT